MENLYLGNGRRWKIKSDNTDFSDSGNKIPGIIKRLLAQRGLKSQSEIRSFLHPTLEDLHDPFLLEGMAVAVDRIISAIENNEKILIYGDYDADGVSATSILLRFFKKFGMLPEYYIPDRIDEGYGISDIAVDYISSNGFDLVITVDCGISGRIQIDAIYEKCALMGKKIDIIVTDHHQCNDDLMPEALAILNPHLPGSQYPFKNLCGAGVALKLVQALGIRLNKPHIFEEYLDIAAIATIADIVSLTGENRIIARFGMDKIISDPCTGLKALLKVSLPDDKTIDSYRMSFILAPRINAAGRMGDAGTAVRLFTTEDAAEAEKLAIFLNRSNAERQQIQDEIYKEAVKIIENDNKYKEQKVLVVYNRGWHHGVIGIVASKLVDRYHKPAFVLSVEEDSGLAVGSGRSIEGFNLFKAMESQAEILVKYGGHEQAGGLKILTEQLPIFRSRINDYADSLITGDMLVPEISIDIEAKSVKDINLDTAKQITYMKPFGEGNPMPVFCYRGATLLDKRVIGDSKHLKLIFDIEGQKAEGIFFGKGYLEKGLFIGDKTDIVFTQEINDFRGLSLQLKLLDMRLSEAEVKRNQLLYKAALCVECLDWDEDWLLDDSTLYRNQGSRTGPESLKPERLDGESISRYNGIIDKTIKFDDIVVNRDILAVIYKYVRRMKSDSISVSDMFVHARILENETKMNINYFKFFVSLLVFDELGLLEFSLGTDGCYRVSFNDEAVKVDLNDSEILNWVTETAASMDW